jgi:hypothetical protein
LTKKGTGRAVLALFDADTDVPCSKAPITLASP